MKVSQMPYTRPDKDKIVAQIEDFIRRFNSAESVEEQFAIDKEIDKVVSELRTNLSLANIRFTQNTKDEFYAKEYDYINEITPEIDNALNNLNKCYLNSKFKSALKERIPQIVFTNFLISAKSIDEKILADMVEENKLCTEYITLMSGIVVEYRGEKLTTAQIKKYDSNPDRELRKGAYMALGKEMKRNGKKIDDIYDKLVKVRTRMAKKLGMESFSELGYLRMTRNCYDSNDIAVFRENVKKYVVPVCCQIKEKIRKECGVDKLMVYDDGVYGREEAVPSGSAQDIVDNAEKMYSQMSGETKKLFETMKESEAFDLLSREGKWGGGYCTELSEYKLPFILSNFNGSSGDVDVLTHEFGHALAAFKSFDVNCGAAWAARQGTMETCEVHSMSMEYFAHRWMELFFGEKADIYRWQHIAESFCFLPYGTIVDYFQQTVYDYYNLTKRERNKFWASIEREFMPWMSVKGVPYFKSGRKWQLKMHIFESPFYYIDYCLAQFTAFQFLIMMRKDFDKAFETYMKFLNQAGTKPFSELLDSVGLKSPFNEEAFIEVVDEMKKILQLE